MHLLLSAKWPGDVSYSQLAAGFVYSRNIEDTGEYE